MLINMLKHLKCQHYQHMHIGYRITVCTSETLSKWNAISIHLVNKHELITRINCN